MINIVVALNCEAEPIIRQYHLKGYGDHHPYRIYEGDGIRLIVCGVGKLAAAAATAYIHSAYACESHTGWFNIGIAGHADKVIGNGSLIHKVTDEGSGKSWYPPLLLDMSSPTDSLVTVDRAEESFTRQAMYDMEASGFFATASRFATIELVHAYKIVSDNRLQSAQNVSARNVQQLLYEHMPAVNKILEQINRLSSSLRGLAIEPDELERFTRTWRFTAYERHRLYHLLRRWMVLAPHTELWNNELEQSRSGKEALTRLQQRIDALPVHIGRQ